MKKYLDDKAVDNAEEDKFGHLNLAKQISEIIKEQSSDLPVNIGLFGKWGVGKSSVVELLEKNVLAKEIEDGDFRFISVNVWKYQSVNSIRNKIFYQIGKVLDVEDRVKRIYENSTTTSNNLDYEDFFKKFFDNRFSKNRFENYGISLCVFAMLVLLLYCIYNLSPQIGFVASSIASILVSGTFVKVGMDFFMKTFVSSTAVISKPFESEEQFEHAVIDLFNEDEFRSMKKILFIDDLDRCSSDKVLITLETIKTFLQINNCIFIVACDQDMVKKAVIDSNKDFKYSDKDGANYLEKFFQHFIYLPPYLPNNLRNYTKNIVLESDLSIVGDLGGKLDTVIYILAYRDIINPRKIKVLLNSFIFDYYSIRSKEGDEKHPLQSGFITQHPERLAVLTVLKIDFPLFVNDLVTDPTLASKIAYGESDIDSEKFKSKYFTGVEDGQKEYVAQLKAYLLLAKDWIPRDFTPYLFVSLETTDFNEFPSVEHIKFLGLIRNGDEGIFKELDELEPAEKVKICSAIGNLQESLNNLVEKRNAAAIFTHVAARFPNIGEYVSSAEVLYSFKANYESLFSLPNEFMRINQEGLGNMVIYAFSNNFTEQGRSLLRKNESYLSSDSAVLFFYWHLIRVEVYKRIESQLLKDEISNKLETKLEDVLNEANHVSLWADLTGPEIDYGVLGICGKGFIEKMASISASTYKALPTEEEKGKYDIGFFQTMLSLLIEKGLEDLVIVFLEKLSIRTPLLYKHYVSSAMKIFGGNPVISAYLMKSENVDTDEATDGEYLMAALSIASVNAFTNEEGKGVAINSDIYKVLEDVGEYLDYYDSERLNNTLISNYNVVLRSNKIDRMAKVGYIIRVIGSGPRITRKEKCLLYLLDLVLKEYQGETLIIQRITLGFASAIKKVKEIGEIELFLKSYSKLVDHSNKIFDIVLVKKLFSLNTKEPATSTVSKIKQILASMRKPLDLVFVVKAMLEEENTAHVNFCLQILRLESTFTVATNREVLNGLPTVIKKSTLKATDGKYYFNYNSASQAMMIEVLILHTIFAFDNNILNYLKTLKVDVHYFNSHKAKTLMMERIMSENKIAQTSLTLQLASLTLLGRISRFSAGKRLDLVLDYMSGMIQKIIADNKSTLKSELQSVYVAFQSEIKAKVYSYPLTKEEKERLESIFRISLKANPKILPKVEKLIRIFQLVK